jgi:NAD(P)-dependent dehydrogenase (short-subunit alcohol dehydrogenase family)
MEMLLENKNAVIYGGGGAIGGAVARAFAREGAKVFLAGRTLAKLDAVAEEITAAGGEAETAKVDALDEQSVEKHITEVAKEAGGIDICFNAIGMEDVQGTSLIEMSLEDFTRPITIATRTQFLAAKAVAPHMIKKGSDDHRYAGTHRLAACRWLRNGLRGTRKFIQTTGGGTRAAGRARRLPAFGRIAGVNPRYFGCFRRR